MVKLIDSVSHSFPAQLIEITTLGRTLKRRAADVLAYFDSPGTSNVRPKPSTGDWNTYAAVPSASATPPTTSPEACSRPAASDPGYTLIREEPRILRPQASPQAQVLIHIEQQLPRSNAKSR